MIAQTPSGAQRTNEGNDWKNGRKLSEWASLSEICLMRTEAVHLQKVGSYEMQMWRVRCG
jgi:hypothetical protein